MAASLAAASSTDAVQNEPGVSLVGVPIMPESVYPRNSTRWTPRMSAAAWVSTTRRCHNCSPSARKPSGTSPFSPRVATTRTTRWPSSAALRITPPTPIDSSSGWAWNVTRVAMPAPYARAPTVGRGPRLPEINLRAGPRLVGRAAAGPDLQWVAVRRAGPGVVKALAGVGVHQLVGCRVCPGLRAGAVAGEQLHLGAVRGARGGHVQALAQRLVGAAGVGPRLRRGAVAREDLHLGAVGGVGAGEIG